jgi:hypothetical protein
MRHDRKRVTALNNHVHAVLFEHLFDQHRNRVEPRSAQLDIHDFPARYSFEFSRSLLIKGAGHKPAPATWALVQAGLKLSCANRA